VEGIEMFLGQAIVQFELWTGQRAPVDVMRKVVEDRL
jgi:shikimate dehydrogenase